MSLSTCYARLPQWMGRFLLPALPYLNLMRALELRQMKPWLGALAGKQVLDVGCGHGLYSLELARRGALLTGVDLDAASVADARQVAASLGLRDRARYLVADAAALALAGGQFDLVISNCVLEHVVDDNAALAGMVRLLRPGGTLYLTVDSAEQRFFHAFLQRLPAVVQGWLIRPDLLAEPGLAAGLNARLAGLYGVRRRYRREELAARLAEQGLQVLDSGFYLSGVGGTQYEAVHLLRGLDPARRLGRLFYMVSSLLLYPWAAWSDNRRPSCGYGIAIAARKRAAMDGHRRFVNGAPGLILG
jgi:SAM-dependent methyltransferase